MFTVTFSTENENVFTNVLVVRETELENEVCDNCGIVIHDEGGYADHTYDRFILCLTCGIDCAD